MRAAGSSPRRHGPEAGPPNMARGTTLRGFGVSDGIAIGQARVLAAPVTIIDRRIARDLVPAEITRLRGAVTAADAQLALLSARGGGGGMAGGTPTPPTDRR